MTAVDLREFSKCRKWGPFVKFQIWNPSLYFNFPFQCIYLLGNSRIKKEKGIFLRKNYTTKTEKVHSSCFFIVIGQLKQIRFKMPWLG